MTIKWDKVGAIGALVIGVLAISVQISTPEIRCHIGLDKSACPRTETLSPPKITQTPNISPPPSPQKEKPSEIVKSPLSSSSPQTTAQEKNEDLQEKLLGSWAYFSSCKINNEPVRLNKITVFNSNKTVTELIFITTTVTSSNFFSTRQRKLETTTQVTYEWSIEDAFLNMKIVDRIGSINDISENGKSIKLDDSIIRQITDGLERSFLRGITSRYRFLDVENDSIVLEKIGGTPGASQLGTE